jgi:hypothetical protein
MLGLGRHHLSALGRTEETKPLVGTFQPVYDNLLSAVGTHAEADAVFRDAGVGVLFAEELLEHAIREVSLRAHAIDDNAITGPAYKALFPDGLDVVLRPVGASQAEVAVALRGRLETQPAAAMVKAQSMDDLDKSLVVFKTSLDARAAAETRLSQARNAESGARERFIAAYDSNIGAIRQLFPRNRKRQDLFFDTVTAKRTSNSGGNTPPAPTPTDDKPK